MRERGSKYIRYSNDILLIIPGGKDEAMAATKFATDEIKDHREALKIKAAKTCVVKFTLSGADLICNHLTGPQGKNGLEYLGFRYDGRKVYVRESTISRLYRKVSVAAKRDGTTHVLSNPSADSVTLIGIFNHSLFSQKFSRVKKSKVTKDYKSWTFYSYLKRATQTFGLKGDRILPQARNFKGQMKERVRKAIVRAHVRQRSQLDLSRFNAALGARLPP